MYITEKRIIGLNKKKAFVFFAVLAACLFLVLIAGAGKVQAATNANTAKESASTEKKLELLEKMEDKADEKTITVGKDNLKDELGVSSVQSALAKINKTYAKKLLAEYGYENTSGNTYETQYPFSRIIVDGSVVGKESKITDEVSTIAIVESDVTTLQYETPEEAALAAADFEDAGYDVYADDLAETEQEEKSSNSSENYEYSMMRLDSDIEGDEEVIVAVIECGGVDIDTLLAYNNGEFADRIIYEEKDGENVYYDAAEGSTTATGGDEHGTEVASTILLNTPDNVKILPIKLSKWTTFGSTGGWGTSTTYQQMAVDYAMENDADIVNMSYAISGTSAAKKYCTAVGGCIDTAIESGMTFVVAADNNNEEVSTFPACYESCWTISAIDSSYTKADFSNYGDEVDFCAPGVGITVLNNSGELDTNSGTSFASPLAAACVANLTSLGGEYKTEDGSCNDARYDYFENICLDLGSSGWDEEYGHGMVTMEMYDLEDAEISFSNSNVANSGFIYNGSARTPAVTVTFGEYKLTKGTHYTVSYSNNIGAGEAEVTVTGIEEHGCTRTKTKTFTINQKSISSVTVTIPCSGYSYTGSAIEPSFTATITLNGSKVTLEEGTDYTVEYLNNTDAGTATIRLTGKGNFTGTKTETFKIVKQYTVTYNSNYTSVVDQKDLTDSCTYTNPSSWTVPDASDFGFETPDGYEFLGWSTSDVYIYGGSVLKWAKFYEAGGVYDEDTLADLNRDILYAVWG